MLPLKNGVRGFVLLRVPPEAASLEERCRGVVQLKIPPKAACFKQRCRESLQIPPKAAYFEGRCQEAVQLRLPPKAACFKRRCREVVRLRIPPKAAFPEERCRVDCVATNVRLGMSWLTKTKKAKWDECLKIAGPQDLPQNAEKQKNECRGFDPTKA